MQLDCQFGIVDDRSLQWHNINTEFLESIVINSMKSSRAITCFRCLYETDVSRTISVIIIIIRDLIIETSVQYSLSDAADSPRRFSRI